MLLVLLVSRISSCSTHRSSEEIGQRFLHVLIRRGFRSGPWVKHVDERKDHPILHYHVLLPKYNLKLLDNTLV